MNLSLKSRSKQLGKANLNLRFAISIMMICIGPSMGCRCPWSCTNNQLSDSHRFLQNGLDSFHDGDHQQAETFLVQAIDGRPEDPILREHLASNYLKQGKTSQAISQLMRAAQLSGDDNAENLVQIGQIYLENGQWILAEQFANQALAVDRRLPQAWVLQADVKFAKGKLNDAIRDFQRALSLNSNQPRVQLKIAEIHRLSGRNLRAYSTIEQMLGEMATDEQPEEALLLASSLLIDLKQPAQAIEKLRIAVNRPDASPDCYLRMASAQMAIGRRIDAQSTLLAASQNFPNNETIASSLQGFEQANEKIASLDLTNGEIIR